MTGYIKNCSSSEISNRSIIILLLLLFLIIFFIIFYFNKINFDEKFDNSQNLSGTFTLNNSLLNIDDEDNNNLLNYQKGISSNNYKGTIYFDNKFDNIPYVYTQINSDDDGVHSVNISNITATSFDYKKNVVGYSNVASETSDNMSMMTLSEDDNSIFNWIAFPK